MKFSKAVLFLILLNGFFINDAFSFNAKPGAQDLEEKIIDLEKRIVYLESKLRMQHTSNAVQSNNIQDQDQIQFNDGDVSHNQSVSREVSDNLDKSNKASNELNLSELSNNNPIINLEENSSRIDSEILIKIKDYYNKAIEEIRMQNYDKSLMLLNNILKSHVDKNNIEIKEILANSNYLIGEIYMKKGDYQNASDHMYESYNMFHSLDEESTQGANSLFQLAKSLKGMSKNDGACNTLKKLKREFSKVSDSLQNKIDAEAVQLKCNFN